MGQSSGAAGGQELGFLIQLSSTVLLHCQSQQEETGFAPSSRDKTSFTGSPPINILVSVLIFSNWN